MGGMFNSTVLDVAIGLIFIYLLLAILCTAINEYIAHVFASRGKLLAKGILGMLSPDSTPPSPVPNEPAAGQPAGNNPQIDLVKDFYQHGLLCGLWEKNGKHPSYISAQTFATIIMDVLAKGNDAAVTFAQLMKGVEKLPPGKAQSALLALLRTAQGDVAKARQAIETWYNNTMDRVTGWYKKHLQLITLAVAIVLTVAANGDTVSIVRQLWKNPVERARIIEAAKLREQKQPPAANVTENPALTSNEQSIIGGFLGWNASDLHFPEKIDWVKWILRLLGWLLTIFAISLGAPFWFDVLRKVMSIRSSGPPPPAAEKKAA